MATRRILIAAGAAAALAFSAAMLAGCGGGGGEGEGKKIEAAAPTAAALPGATVYLAQAQFIQERGKDGKNHAVPGPARMVILTRGANGWDEEVVEDPESNVFHKAMWYAPPEGEPGILTIGAVGAHLKIWRRGADGWTGESLWNPTFGGEYDRLRDFEVADVDGDGADEIAIATHDQGVVAVMRRVGGGWVAEELYREGNTFVHEIETGDVDGDGRAEVFSTPSLPNKLDGSEQPGRIDRYDYEKGGWVRSVVAELPTRHVKEILCVTPDGEERPVLFAALEGEKIGGAEQGDSTRIRLYRFARGAVRFTDIAGLPGNLCRFLVWADTDGDGARELIASTKSEGIWRLDPPAPDGGDEWSRRLVARGTSGFEHATFASDLDGDGRDDLVVASDDQKELRVYRWDGSAYKKGVIGPLKGDTITFNVTTRVP
ncbi:MAG: VCBS repeat-containing protein [Candidatus Eisenbacteria bacterium]|nr:VCBS repeat-containing protein [Candidatus Eisenbacteria bacterium]